MRKDNYIQISYKYGNDSQVGSLRNYYIFKHLGERYQNRFLLSTTDQELESGTKIQVNAFDYSKLIPSTKRRITQNRKNPIYKFLAQLKNSYPFFIFLNLGGLQYIISSVLKLRKLVRNYQNIVIFSSYDPMADHLIAYWTKRKREDIFWIADFRDLPIDPVKKNSLWPKIDQWFLKKLLQKADLVTTVSHGLAGNLRTLSDNILVIPNAIDSQEIQVRLPKSDEIFRIGYTGSVHRELQAISPLLQACQRLSQETEIRFELHYAGPQSDYWINKINEIQSR